MEHQRTNTHKERFGGPIDALGLFTRGLAMGIADVIPGVSGGTIAFISGIYERFIEALRSLSARFLFLGARGRTKESIAALRQIHWHVLIPLGLGIAIAMVGFSKLVTGFMEDEPGPTYALFFGLILASSWMPLARAKKYTWKIWAAMLVAASMSWVFVGARGGGIDVERISAEGDSPPAAVEFFPAKLRDESDLDALLSRGSDLVVFDPKGITAGREINGVTVLESDEALEAWLATDPQFAVVVERRASLFAIFGAGAIAISAMILPGVSGSFLLLFLGQYQAVFNTLHRCVGHVGALLGREPDPLTQLAARGALSDFLFFGAFLAGVGVGLILFSRVVSWLLHRAHDVTMAALTGVMLGALRIPGGVVLESIPDADTGGYWTAVSIAALIGAVLVLGLHFADVQLRKRRIVPAGD